MAGRDGSYHTMPSLKPGQGLRFKLVLVLLLAIALALAASWYSNRYLLHIPLSAEADRFQVESAEGVAAQIERLVVSARDIAIALSALAQAPQGQQSLITALTPLADETAIVAIGLWPQPARDDDQAPRGSSYWIYHGTRFERREDYNDVRTVPYWHEAWYTPARYTPAGHCYWTPSYRDALLEREVLTCAAPILRDGRFAGAATVSLDRRRLATRLLRDERGPGRYALLLDRESQVLAMTPTLAQRAGEGRPATTAELAKRLPALAPLMLAIHHDFEDRTRATVSSERYDASAVSDLRDTTRGMSRDQTEAALLSLWSLGAPVQRRPLRLELADDPILGEPIRVAILPVPEADWRLVHVIGARSGFAGMDSLVARSLAAALAAATGLLLLGYLGVDRLIVARLRRIARTLDEGAHGTPVEVHDQGRDEIGLLAHWNNERLNNVHELREQIAIGQAALQSEAEARRQAERARGAGETRLAQILGAVADAVVVTDLEGRIENLNLAAETQIGRAARDLVGRPFDEVFILTVVDDHNCEQLSNLAQRAVAGNNDIILREPVRLSLPKGPQDVHVSATVLCTPEGRVSGAVVVMRFADAPSGARPATQAAVIAAGPAAADPDGRAACDRLLRRLQEQARLLPRKHALLYVDVDHLRAVNAAAGIDAGNEALDHIWRVLAGQLEKPEMAFRLSADQFALVLDNCSAEQALSCAERCRDAVAGAPLRWEQRDFPLSISVGVVVFNGEGTAFDVLKRAEDACLTAKAAGVGQIRLFEASMQRGNAVDEDLWMRRIRDGLEKNRFHLTTQWMQPLTGLGEAFEILLSLEDEEGFWTKAQQFLPIVERNRMGRELDRWVIEHTLAALARCPKLGRMAFCSINLSAESLEAPEMLDLIVSSLQAHPDVPASQLAFEIREEAVADRPADALRFCETLRHLGCKIALDQFVGRRGNDLALLRDLPLDYVKISARQFRNIAEDHVERLVAESVLRLAKTLELRAIVTGVEDASELTSWNALGADYLQGYLIAKPTPVIFSSPTAAAGEGGARLASGG